MLTFALRQVDGVRAPVLEPRREEGPRRSCGWRDPDRDLCVDEFGTIGRFLEDVTIVKPEHLVDVLFWHVFDAPEVSTPEGLIKACKKSHPHWLTTYRSFKLHEHSLMLRANEPFACRVIENFVQMPDKPPTEIQERYNYAFQKYDDATFHYVVPLFEIEDGENVVALPTKKLVARSRRMLERILWQRKVFGRTLRTAASVIDWIYDTRWNRDTERLWKTIEPEIRRVETRRLEHREYLTGDELERVLVSRMHLRRVQFDRENELARRTHRNSRALWERHMRSILDIDPLIVMTRNSRPNDAQFIGHWYRFRTADGRTWVAKHV